MKKETKEEVAGGIFAGTALTTMLLSFIFLSSPAFYYFGKWNDIWQDRPATINEITPINQSNRDNEFKADRECRSKATEAFGVTTIFTYFASSTSPDYGTYDCYGIRFEKLTN